LEEPLNVWDYERLAEKRLDPAPFAYYVGGAGDEWTLRENVAAFRRWVLRPRVLVDVSGVTTATTVLGTDVSMPVLVAPTAAQKLAHPDGETATARAAAAAGTIMCLSTFSTSAPADVSAAAPDAVRWFQLYWHPDRGVTRSMVEQAVALGFRAIALTVDLPRVGRRERDLRTPIEAADDYGIAVFESVLEPVRLTPEVLDLMVADSVTWRDIEWLRALTELPLVVKGVLTAEDAVLACEHGATGIVVSNHGGRQLDGVAASLDALPEVVDAVGDRCEVLMDGGVRRGTDVLKALALGARAVLVGRPVLWGLAVDGADGVRRVLDLLRAEVELGLALLGCPSPEAVTRAHIARAAA
jgi:isopentenyl diphosphate isomerase/L-lactate dehydrogenase-like FMN-dependent dehydrogenase